MVPVGGAPLPDDGGLGGSRVAVSEVVPGMRGTALGGEGAQGGGGRGDRVWWSALAALRGLVTRDVRGQVG